MSKQKVPLPESAAWLYEDDARSLREIGQVVVYQQRQTFCPTPEPRYTPLYTADQLQSYSDAREQAGWNAALEWAAKVCERTYDEPGLCTSVGDWCAAAIREGKK